MIFINPKSPQKDILPFVKNWMRLLAEQRDDACALIDEPNSYGVAWTSDRIRQIVTETLSPYTRFYLDHPEGPIFSDPFDLEEQRDIEVIELNDGSGYVFDYHLPLNGEWSDLTAQFEFYKKSGGYAVVLHDLHVL
jgi:hypothetical protein